MRKLRTALAAGIVAVAVAGVAVTAAERVHVMKVDLPDGGVAQIHYIGDVAPQIQLVRGEAVAAQATPQRIAIPVAFADPFAQMDLMMAQMEQRHHAMMQQIAQMERAAAAMQADAAGAAQGNGQTLLVSEGALPPGAVVQYSFYSSSNGKNGCTQSVEWRSDGSGQQPQVTRASSGNCESVQRSNKPQPVADVVKPAKPAAKPAPAAQEDQSHLLPGRST